MSTITTRTESAAMLNMPSDSSEVTGGSQAITDMGALRIAFNKLMVTMRNKQQEYALQNQQQSLKMTEKAFAKEQASIASARKANVISTAITGVMGGIGAGAGGMKIGGAVSASKKALKLSKIDKQMHSGIAPQQAYENVMGKKKLAALENVEGKKEAWDKKWSDDIFDDEGNVLSTPLEQLQASSAGGSKWTMAGEGLGVFSHLGEPISKGASMSDSVAAQSQKVEADRAKTFQQIEERESHLAEDRARDTSQKMREAARDFNELYSKISSAVRW